MHAGSSTIVAKRAILRLGAWNGKQRVWMTHGQYTDILDLIDIAYKKTGSNY